MSAPSLDAPSAPPVAVLAVVMVTAPRARTISVRLLRPFLRAAGDAADTAIAILDRHGISAGQIVHAEARVSSAAAMAALESYVDASGDDLVALRAGAAIEPGDLDVMECAARACATLREAIACSARHVHLVCDDVRIDLFEEADEAHCVFRAADGGAPHPAASAFAVAAAATFVRRHTRSAARPTTVHLRLQAPPATRAYAETIGCAALFGMPRDAVVVERGGLDARMDQPCRALQEAFEAHAARLSSGRHAGFRCLTREVAASELASGRLTMQSAAGALGVSAATLRRRLQEERTTFREVVDEVRCDLAEGYLRDQGRSIGEIATLLGFSYVAAFNKAFRRWKGVSPSEHRSRAVHAS
jgi:AraC-like DNA-binding protein